MLCLQLSKRKLGDKNGNILITHHHLSNNFKQTREIIMIKSKSEKISTKLEIDLTGPEGNAFVLIGYAKKLGQRLGYDDDHIDRIIDEMTLTDYEGLLHTFDREFGTFVTLWR